MLSKAHTGENLGNALKDLMSVWKLERPTTQIPVVSDNASNMDIAAKTAELHPHIKSFAHTGILCQVWYLILSIPDLCTLTHFAKGSKRMQWPDFWDAFAGLLHFFISRPQRFQKTSVGKTSTQISK